MTDKILILKDLENEAVLDELSRNAGFESWGHVLDYADSCGGACAIDLINPYIYRYDIEGLLQQALEHPEDTPLIAHAYQANLERKAQKMQKRVREQIRVKRLANAYMRAKDENRQEDAENTMKELTKILFNK